MPFPKDLLNLLDLQQDALRITQEAEPPKIVIFYYFYFFFKIKKRFFFQSIF